MEAGIDYKPIARKHMAIAERWCGESCKVYTLDGVKPAKITAAKHSHAKVALLDGGTYEFSWECVDRKMNSDKLFYVC